MNLLTTTNKKMMSSKEIAELTNKTPKNVVRDIRDMLDKLDGSKLIHEQYQEVKDNRGYTSEFLLDHDLTILLVTGYDINARMTVIKRWKELEAQVALPQPLSIEQLLQQNVLMLQDLNQKVITLEKTIELDKPMTDFGKAVSASSTAVLIGDWIKALADQDIKIGRNKAFNWFRDKGYLMKDNMPYQQYVNQGLFEIKETLISTPKGQKINFTTMLTGKGQVYFAEKLKAAY
jgi:phage antirepressor YoqD-like protein